MVWQQCALRYIEALTKAKLWNCFFPIMSFNFPWPAPLTHLTYRGKWRLKAATIGLFSWELFLLQGIMWPAVIQVMLACSAFDPSSSCCVWQSRGTCVTVFSIQLFVCLPVWNRLQMFPYWYVHRPLHTLQFWRQSHGQGCSKQIREMLWKAGISQLTSLLVWSGFSSDA